MLYLNFCYHSILFAGLLILFLSCTWNTCMKPKLLLPTNFYSLFCFVLFFCVISLQVQSQTAYDWYAKELANKEHNDYWASVVVDTVIKLEFVSTNPNSIAPASLRYGQAVDLKSFYTRKSNFYYSTNLFYRQRFSCSASNYIYCAIFACRTWIFTKKMRNRYFCNFWSSKIIWQQ